MERLRDGLLPETREAAPKATRELKRSPGTKRLESAGPADALLSPRRLAMARDYAEGIYRIPQMNDPAFMYKTISDERAYQTRLLFQRKKALSQLPPDHPRITRLTEEIREGQIIIKMLFGVLKQVTGRQGTTGGTDFLSDKN
ncbi:MAG: hypothetical protein VKN33_07005 [Candidatus Sericytochromatia bacterium]|nr:hypothetical protein [Candidatus Sericytochromatia bacterium]